MSVEILKKLRETKPVLEGKSEVKVPSEEGSRKRGNQWRQKVTFRKNLVHECFGVSVPTVYDVVVNELLVPKKQLRKF